MDSKKNTGTFVPPAAGTGTSVPPGTAVPPSGTGTAIPPGTGTAVPPSGTGTAVPPSGTGTAVPPGAPQSSANVSSTALIPEYDEYIIKGIRYRVCKPETAKTLAKKSGEAKIFVVENGGRKFVLKLYIPGHSPNHTILDEVQKAKGGFMIALHDHGRWADPGHPGMTLDYEIMAYAPYGSLADLKLHGDEKLFRDVAWRMAFCIKQCHDHHILHRDIKPENFLFTDAARTQFVITDFGIARTLTGRGPVKVDTAKSSYFVSPEGSMSSKDRTTFVDTPTDYYSMGMTLLALWIGLDNFYALFPYDQLEELDRLKLNNRVISEIGDDMLGLSAHARSLLERLLEAGDQNRADFNEIKRWYEGETLKTGSAAEAATSKSAFSVTFDETKGKVAHSREELAQMMLSDMEFAKSFIYRGMAKNALQASFPRLAAEIDDIPQRLYPRPEEQSTGVYAACLILDPTIPFIGRKGRKCNSPKEISDELCAEQNFYATELKKKASPLWAFLKTRGDAVKNFPDKYQPMIQRSGAHGVFALCLALDPSLTLDDAKGKPIKTIKELSDMIWANKGTMAAELANPDHMIWTWLASLGPNAAKLAASYPPKIKSGGTSALYALCLELNKDMAYTGKKGNTCRTEKEIGGEIWANLAEYRKELTHSNHLLWQYMRTWNDSWRKIADTYPALIQKDADNYIFDLVYRLDPSKPYTVQSPTDKAWKGMSSFDELIAFAAKNGLSDLSLKTLTQQNFITWLTLSSSEADRKRGALLGQLVSQAGSNAPGRGWYFLYTLSPELGFYLKKGDCATVQQLGQRINNELNGNGSRTLLNSLLSPATFRGSRLFQYMQARKMQSYVDGILRIIDVQANISAHKSAPYDETIAAWKVVDYLGATPEFSFPQSKVMARSLDDVRRVSQTERNSAISRGLPAFLALFFHERKGSSFSFGDLKAYHDFLESYCPAHPGLQKSAAVRGRVSRAVDDRDSAWRSLRRTRRLVMWTCLPIMVAVVTWMLITSFTDGSEALSEAFMSIGKFIAIGLAIVGAIAGAEGGIIGMVIGGLIGYWVPYWIFGLLSGVAPYILALLVIGAAVYCMMKLNKSVSDTHIPSQTDYDNLRRQADMYMVCEAFGTTSRTFGNQNIDPSVVFDRSKSVAQGARSTVRKAAWGMILVTAITLVIGVSLMKSVDNFEAVDDYTTTPIETLAELTDEWTGTFHGREATMNLTYDGTSLYGTVTIQYSTPMVQAVTGKMETPGNLVLTVDDNPNAQYVGYASLKGDAVEYSGVYTNTAKGTQHDFIFSQPN